MVKYYAVAVGKKTGIFTNWDECSKYVNGYSGAVYKSFAVKSDAEKWLKDQGKKESSEDEDSTEEEKFEYSSDDSEEEEEYSEEELPEEEELEEKEYDYALFKQINSLLKGMEIGSNNKGFDWWLEDGSWIFKQIEMGYSKFYGFQKDEFYTKREFIGKFMIEINKMKIPNLLIMIKNAFSQKRWVDDLCECLNKKLNYKVERLYIITWGDDVSPDYIINLLSENKYFQNTRILIMDDKKITKHTNVKLFLEEKKSNYKIDEKKIECIYNISKKIKDKNIILTKNEYIQILDILNEVEQSIIQTPQSDHLPIKEEIKKQEIKPPVKRTKTLEIYTDGSHFKNSKSSENTKGVRSNGGSGRKGFGVYFPKNEGGFTPKNISIEVDQKFMKSEFKIIETAQLEIVSNPTMEIAACCFGLKSVIENLDKLKDIKLIKSYADYNGVQFWLNGTWRITKPYIQKIVDLIRVYEKKISEAGISIEYIHVNGHVGIEGNEMADKLAKGLIKAS